MLLSPDIGYRFGFVFAMQEEMQAVLKLDPSMPTQEAVQARLQAATRLGGKCFVPFTLPVEGRSEGLPCLAVLSGIGKVNAASATALLLSHFKVRQLVNMGFCGAVDTRHPMGTLYLGEYAVQGDVDISHFGYLYGQVAMTPHAFYPAYVPDGFYDTLKAQGASVFKGVIISTDKFIASTQLKHDLITQLTPSAQKEGVSAPFVGMEMEAGAILHVAEGFGTPVIIVKEVSDGAEEEADQQFSASAYEQANALSHAARALQQLAGMIA